MHNDIIESNMAIINENGLKTLFEKRRGDESSQCQKNKEFLKMMLLELTIYKEDINDILETLTYMRTLDLKEQLDDCVCLSSAIKRYQFGYQRENEDQCKYNYLYYTNYDYKLFDSYIIKYYPDHDYIVISYTTALDLPISISAKLTEHEWLSLDATPTAFDFIFSQRKLVKFMNKFIERIPNLLNNTIKKINEIK